MTSYTFCQLLDRFGRVEIPTIQRDYVQGRNEQKVVRDGFLSTIYEALTCDDANRALDLDFVYGSLANNSSSPAFQPLDGQQRLTTLFLLHWYLAWQGNAGDDFRNRFAVGDRSRFGYEVRPSSRDFINALATHFPSVDAADCTSLSGAIKNEPWYFRGWRLDPTIQSALDMLDTLHERFVDTSGLYHRLVDETKPSITFQLLELEKFGLSDDLYIKMNARGKPLTAFETFKARFEDELQRLFDGVPVPAACQGRPVAEFFSHRIDTAWSEFFWPFRDHRTATFDEAVMNLLRAVIIVTRSPEPGVHLHYSGQRDLLRVFEGLAETNTILYTTHLASMVDQANPERVRIVESRDNHLAINHGVVSSQAAPMAVIEASLGLTADLSGMLGNRKVLIVEGGTDALIMNKLSGILTTAGKVGLSDQVYLWPAATSTKAPMYAAFAIGQRWDAGVLLDSDDAGLSAKKKISEMTLKELAAGDGYEFRVLMLGQASGIKKTDVAIEDLFPDDFYRECVNRAYGIAIRDEDLPVDGSTLISKRVEKVLKERHGKDLDKKVVLSEMLRDFDSWGKMSDLPKGSAVSAEKLFKSINAAFKLE